MRPLAAKIGVGCGHVGNWIRCPQDHLFKVAAASGIDAETVRPDLAEFIRLRRRQNALARGMARFAIAATAAAGGEMPGEDEFVDLMVIFAAIRFVARRRGLEMSAVVFGQAKAEEAARSRAMSLAVVVGRVSSTSVAGAFGCSRQNVDNAALRYQRARDGDDPDDLVDVDDDGAETRRDHVIERGRLRRAKADGDPALWAEQDRFEGLLEGKK